jgi:hypothetical protein
VNPEVEADDDPLDRSLALELGVAENSGGRVVEDVEELEGLLLEDEEDGVDELDVLEVVVDHVVGNQRGLEGLGRADGPVGAVLEQAGDNLLNDEDEQQARAEREEDIVDLEGDLEFERGAVAEGQRSAANERKRAKGECRERQREGAETPRRDAPRRPVGQTGGSDTANDMPPLPHSERWLGMPSLSPFNTPWRITIGRASR